MRIGMQVENKGKFIKTSFSKDDLTRHAVILGSTGSGKTGLGIKLLESLAVEGVPIIAIDPKGDLGNIFNVPMLDERCVDCESEGLKSNWVNYLCTDVIDRAKLKMVDGCIYTPGLDGEAGIQGGKPMGIFGSSMDSKREMIKQVLSMAYGYEVTSLATQYVFLEKSIEAEIEAYPSMSRQITPAYLYNFAMHPRLKKIGGMDLDDFISEGDRLTLARKLTCLYQSKDFKRWMYGELDVTKLFVGDNHFSQRVGIWEKTTPKLSVISIAHLTEQDRKFFLPIFLSELVQTMRGWQGTDKLRAVLYIDECVGMLPPVSTPPTKNWLMTLLKQARAYGLGVVLATQNPADLDYRALGNVGNWWVGRLQTDRDRSKVREAIRGSETGVDLGDLGKLKPRQFVQSILGSDPVTVKSIDCLSRLTGPMTLEDISQRTWWRWSQPIQYKQGENQYELYRRMLVTGAKAATTALADELMEIKQLRLVMPNKMRKDDPDREEGEQAEGLPDFLWREGVKPVLKARLRQVQDDLMQAYLKDAKSKVVMEKVG